MKVSYIGVHHTSLSASHIVESKLPVYQVVLYKGDNQAYN